jgi:hypothetical protein
MRFSPSIVPGSDRDVYLVLDQFGRRLGRGWRETDEEDVDRDTLLRHLLDGQYSNPIRIVSFNTGEGWSRDASEEVAEELRQRCADRGEVPPSLEEFLGRHGHRVDIQLSLCNPDRRQAKGMLHSTAFSGERMADDLLERMRQNLQAGWTIDDVARVCREHGISCAAPHSGGSHYRVFDKRMDHIMTVPFRRSNPYISGVGSVSLISSVSSTSSGT